MLYCSTLRCAVLPMAHLGASDCCTGALGPVVKHTVLTSNETSLLVLVLIPAPRHSHMELRISSPLGRFSSGQQEQQHCSVTLALVTNTPRVVKWPDTSIVDCFGGKHPCSYSVLHVR